MKFKERKHFHDVTVTCVAAGTCVEAAASYPENAAEITDEGGYAK